MKKFILILIFSMLYLTKSTYTFAASATSSAAINDEVQKRITEIKNSGKAYVGTVTDKTQNTLQLRTEKGEIKLISVDQNTIKVFKTTPKTTSAKFDDIAIGDFIIALGTRNGNDILNSTRISITTATDRPKRKILSGKITSIVKKDILIDVNGVSYTLKFPKKWLGPEIKELSENDKILVVGEAEGNIFTLRSIFKI